MSDEVNGTAQNSASTGDSKKLESAANIHFDHAALAKGSDSALLALIAEFRGLRQGDPNFRRMELTVNPFDGESVPARKDSLRAGLLAAGALASEFVLKPD